MEYKTITHHIYIGGIYVWDYDVNTEIIYNIRINIKVGRYSIDFLRDCGFDVQSLLPISLENV